MDDTGAAEVPVPTVEVGSLLPRLDRGDRVLLLDVRNDDEFETWRVEARRPVETVHVPYFEFIEDTAASIAKVPRDREGRAVRPGWLLRWWRGCSTPPPGRWRGRRIPTAGSRSPRQGETR